MEPKKIVISCGPIPARLDSVKFITNRFKGGLTFRTAAVLVERGYDVTVVMWKFTQLPDVNGRRASEFWMQDNVHIVTVSNVFDYCQWFRDNAMNYDAFIMAAAVANLTPCEPYEGKFPSHNYAVGETFPIYFEIAPRAIDVVKRVNPRACLIGYKLFDGSLEELILAARVTRKESRANIIFANTPSEAKEKKYAVMADNSVVECSFTEHIELIIRAIEARYFKTVRTPRTKEEKADPRINEAFATVKMFEQTFAGGFGTVAVPVEGMDGAFVTTSRGHKGPPVLVRGVDFAHLTIDASDKATLNAPTLAVALWESPADTIIVHRHDDDPLFVNEPAQVEMEDYLFPGSLEEAERVEDAFRDQSVFNVKLLHHGDLRRLPIRPVDWNQYYRDFPERYFKAPWEIQQMLEFFEVRGKTETLEVGGNKHSCTKYAYDPYVSADNAFNLTWHEVMDMHFDLVVAKNSVNYLTADEIVSLLSRTDRFIANTFLYPPDEKVTDREAAVRDQNRMLHTLRLPDDSIARHQFFAYTGDDYRAMGLKVERYGKNSALLMK